MDQAAPRTRPGFRKRFSAIEALVSVQQRAQVLKSVRLRLLTKYRALSSRGLGLAIRRQSNGPVFALEAHVEVDGAACRSEGAITRTPACLWGFYGSRTEKSNDRWVAIFSLLPRALAKVMEIDELSRRVAALEAEAQHKAPCLGG
ncbi:MAG: hypothetical protein ACREV4_16935 [Gammaproteobacteria bacterium]